CLCRRCSCQGITRRSASGGGSSRSSAPGNGAPTYWKRRPSPRRKQSGRPTWSGKDRSFTGRRKGGTGMDIVHAIGREQMRKDIPDFKPGDTVSVHVKVVEGNRERIQVFEGTVIRRKGSGIQETFTVRRMSYGVGVERTFPVHSPRIEKIEVKRR